jgi:predicted nucleic acid-binding protein
MTVAYVDSSCLVAIGLEEPGGEELAARLTRYDRLLSSSLLEAELQSVFAREKVDGADHLLTWITWVFPDRSLGPEIGRVLRAGYLRGSDLWHVANALYASESPSDLPFVTLDSRQREVAGALGFPTG